MGKITGQLKLERFDKNYRLLERRVQPMRSWTKGLIELLYTHASLVPAGTPYANNGDPDNNIRNLYLASGGATYRSMANTGQVVGGGGYAGLPAKYPAFQHNQAIMGSDIGIQIGNGNTAVTPTDKRLARRIGHGTRIADAVDAIFVSCITDDDAAEQIQSNDNFQIACPFIPQQDFRCSSVEIKVYKTGIPTAALTVEIRSFSNVTTGTYVFEFPSTTVLATGTIAEAAIGASPGAFVACSFGTPVDLYAGHRYFIVIHSTGVDGTKFYHWRYDTAGSVFDLAPGYTRAENTYDVICNDAWAASPATWNWGRQLMFKAIGQSIGEMEYGGMELVHRVTANPNDAFDLKRFFYNRSGAAIDVKEVGINASTPIKTNAAATEYKLWMQMIARDVVAPAVTVANTELLLVTYTPAITV